MTSRQSAAASEYGFKSGPGDAGNLFTRYSERTGSMTDVSGRVRKFKHVKPTRPIAMLIGALIVAPLSIFGVANSEGTATLAFLFFLLAAIVAGVLAVLRWNLKHPDTLDLGLEGAVMCKSTLGGGYWFPKYTQIQAIELGIDPKHAPNFRTLRVKTRVGDCCVNSPMFASMAEFDEFAAELEARVNADRAARGAAAVLVSIKDATGVSMQRSRHRR
jgi:hypothetical protein